MQQQQRIVWPAEPVVARAYIDQLTRTAGISPERTVAVNAALDLVETDYSWVTLSSDLEALATELESDAEEAVRHDIGRLRSLAETLRGIAAAGR